MDKKLVESLQSWHIWLAIIFGVQAIGIAFLSVSQKFPIVLYYLAPNPLSESNHLVAASHSIFEVNLTYLVVAFLLTTATSHLLFSTVYRKFYEKKLALGLNQMQLFEFGLSTTILLTILVLLGGVYDLASILMIIALIVIAFAIKFYLTSFKKPDDFFLKILIAFAVIIPWITLALYIFGTHVYGLSQLPDFVYWVYGIAVLLLSATCLNRYLQKRKRGRWSDFIFGEKIYLFLSLVTKTVISWQIFAGILRA